MAHDGAASAGDFAVNHAKGVFTNRPIDRTADIKTKCLLRGGLRIVPGDPQVSLVATGDSPLVLRQAIKRAAVALTRSGLPRCCSTAIRVEGHEIMLTSIDVCSCSVCFGTRRCHSAQSGC